MADAINSSQEDIASDSQKVIFFVPHQDDELLTSGIRIIEALREGEVTMVLCTDGSNCPTRLTLNDGKKCEALDDDHRYELDCSTYGACRDVEFAQSCRALGVSEESIHFVSPRMVDGRITFEEAKAIIYGYIRKYPDATVFTHVPIEGSVLTIPADEEKDIPSTESLYRQESGVLEFGLQHPDHRNIGLAALELYEEGHIKKLEFGIEVYHFEQFRRKHPNAPLIEHAIDEDDRAKLNRAVDEYYTWDPENKRFALGFHSGQKWLDPFRERNVQYSTTPRFNEPGKHSEKKGFFRRLFG